MASHTLGLAISRNMTDKKQVEGKGWGLYAKEDILADEDVVSVPSTLVISLDIPRLKDTCYSCLGYKHFCQSTEETNWGDDATLQICTGCHVVRYCSKVRLQSGPRNTKTSTLSLRNLACSLARQMYLLY
jgi:hypothetical protein